MHAEMSVLDVIPGEDWPLFIDGERVGTIENWETGQRICEILNEYEELREDLTAIREAVDNCGIGGIYAGFHGVPDAIRQLAQYIRQEVAG